jgi:hypothetical protein
VCLVNAAEQQDPNWIQSADGKACSATYGLQGNARRLRRRVLSPVRRLQPEHLVAFNACLAKPCSDVAACVEGVIPL